MKLTYRQQNIIKELMNSEDFQTIESYASMNDVSIRTIHKDLDEIEHFLQGSNVLLVRKAGVGICVEGSFEERQVVLKNVYESNKNNDTLSTDFRRLRISSFLLNHKEGSSVQKLADEYLVSKSSIVIDLERIKEWCSKFNLELIKDRSGTKIIGLEKDIRHAMANLINEYKNIEGIPDCEYDENSRLDMFTQYRLNNLFKNISLKKVESILVENERRLNYKINDISFSILITHLMIMIQRIQNGDSLRLNAFINQENTSDLAFKTAKSIANELTNVFKIHINSEELQFIYTYLVSLGIQSNFRNLEFDEYVLSIDPKIKDITRKIIDLVSNITQINLSKDEPLYFGLMTHLKPMISRIKYKVVLKNPLINEIKTKYASIFSVLYLLVPEFNELLNATINDDELGFMAIHFQAALERNAPNQRVVIVCPEGIGFSRFLANRITKFVPNIEIVDIIPAQKASKLDSSNIDFIISTIPLTQRNLPVILVSSLADFNDIRTISNFIIEKSVNPSQVRFENLKNMIDPSLVFFPIETDTKQDIIHQVSKKMNELDYVTKEFENSVFEREIITPTCLGNEVAIPHGKQEFVNSSKLAIIIPKKQVEWTSGKASLIFLIAINLRKDDYAKDALTDLYNLLDSPEMLERLRTSSSIIEVLNVFQ